MVSQQTATRVASVLVTAVVAAGCAANGVGTTGASPESSHGRKLPEGRGTASMPAPDSCTTGHRNGQPLPDPDCTPGAVNADVKQSDIDSTICKSGWTATVRPPSSLMSRMKAKSARSYGVARDVDGEYDHLIPLELGGATDDPRNLWFEPGHIPNPKDAVEHKLNDAVCSGLITLGTAQHAIAKRWVTAFDDAGLRVSGGKVCLRDHPTRCAHGRHGGGSD